MMRFDGVKAMKIRNLLYCLLLVSLLSSGCTNGDKFTLIGINKTKAVEVRGLIANELSVGTSSYEVEAFFRRHNIGFSFNRFDQRYQAIIRDVDDSWIVDQAVVIHIYVDEEKSFVSSEVRDSFTAL